MKMLMLLLLCSEGSLRDQAVAAMGLDKPFQAYTLTSSNTMEIAEYHLFVETVETVDAHSPRYSRGPNSALKSSGFDGQRIWESQTKAGMRPKEMAIPDAETLQMQARHEWWLFLPIVLTDPSLQPLPLKDADGRVGIRFMNPHTELPLADIYIVEGLPVEAHFYGPPNFETGEQRITTNVYSDYRTVDGRTFPYHITVEDSIFRRTVDGPSKLTAEVVSWVFHDKIDPTWFVPPAGSVFR